MRGLRFLHVIEVCAAHNRKSTNVHIDMAMKKVLLYIVLTFLASCATTTTTVHFLCNEEDLQIYVNDEYVGTGLVTYVAPPNVTSAEVSCKKDGIVIFTKTYYIKGHNKQLFDLNVPSYNSYSSDRQIHSK